ncbi:MAG: tetratricopeptide repeat protein [archaeon]|nr:tetratricopeptide repeat protein [archaeon]
MSPKIDVSLDIEKLRGLKIPDKEEALLEIVKEFNETLRTIGIPASFDPSKRLDLSPFQKEVAKIVEEKVDEVLDKFKKPTGDPMTYIRLGAVEACLENYDKAIDYCKKAIERDFNSIAAWAVMGACYDKMGEHEKALRCYDTVLRIEPSKIDKEKFDLNILLAWGAKGGYYVEIGEYEKAIECFDKISEINPDLPVWDRKGIALSKLGRHEEAINCFDKALKIDPKCTDAWNLKGVTFRNSKKYDDAIECLNRALEIDPKIAYAWNAKGHVLWNLRRYEEADGCFDKSLEINPEDADAWRDKGNSLFVLAGLKYKEFEQGNNGEEKINEYKELLERSLASFNRLIELSPNDNYARERIKEIQKVLSRLHEALSEFNSRKKGDIEKIAEYLHGEFYDNLTKEQLVDFLQKLPKEVGEVYTKSFKSEDKTLLVKWFSDYIIPPLEDYYFSKKGHYLLLNNASLIKFIEGVVDDEDQKEELLEVLPYMGKNERIELFKDLTKCKLEKIKKEERK